MYVKLQIRYLPKQNVADKHNVLQTVPITSAIVANHHWAYINISTMEAISRTHSR